MIGDLLAILTLLGIGLVLVVVLREQFAEERSDAADLARHEAERAALGRSSAPRLSESADHDWPGW